jgi:hypothetical protein
MDCGAGAEGSDPQRLKPRQFIALYGTAEAVPFPKPSDPACTIFSFA